MAWPASLKLLYSFCALPLLPSYKAKKDSSPHASLQGTIGKESAARQGLEASSAKESMRHTCFPILGRSLSSPLLLRPLGRMGASLLRPEPAGHVLSAGAKCS